MDSLSYYVRGCIQLDDISECLSVAEYNTFLHTDIIDGRLRLQVENLNDKSEVVAVWRWSQKNEQWSDLETEDRELLVSEWHTVKVIFNIEYSAGNIGGLSTMMIEVFRYFGGFVRFHGQLFDSHNVSTMSDYYRSMKI